MSDEQDGSGAPLDGEALLARADEIAAAAHAGQVDKAGQPYIQHPRRVADLVEGADTKAAALLHDVVEDTDITTDDLHRRGIPDHVIDAVEAVTKRPGEAYEDSVARAVRHHIARRVKAADLASPYTPGSGTRVKSASTKRQRSATPASWARVRAL